MNGVDDQGYPSIAYIRTTQIVKDLPGDGFKILVSYTPETAESRPYLSPEAITEKLESLQRFDPDDSGEPWLIDLKSALALFGERS